jgi:diadenosine tetraphosphate (Ap4A) HIT family hydrolase
LCCGVDPDQHTPLSELLPPRRSRFVAATRRFAAIPTLGCFVPGYLLVVPRQHVLTFGQLAADAQAEAQDLLTALAERLGQVYGLPVLGFEYGLASAGVRRIEHAHWHLLPSEADLAGRLDEQVPGRRIKALTDLPEDHSYIAVRRQDTSLRLYNVEGPLESHQRIRLRRLVAALDPRVDDAAWDWADHQFVDLVRKTVADLAAAPTPSLEDPR